MKPDKVFCVMFLFASWGVDRSQNLAEHNRWLSAFMQLTNRNPAITIYSRGPSYINLGLLVCFFDVRRLHNHFPLLTMS